MYRLKLGLSLTVLVLLGAACTAVSQEVMSVTRVTVTGAEIVVERPLTNPLRIIAH
ncbi:MAG: hypothetical protein H6658_01700 [Ardenticatenaceae bacterium]|nr:hypothetical protein [Ardenticatenaceae bacterium]